MLGLVAPHVHCRLKYVKRTFKVQAILMTAYHHSSLPFLFKCMNLVVLNLERKLKRLPEDPIFAISSTLLQYGLAFYLQYLAHWPEYFQVIESPTGQIMGYSE